MARSATTPNPADLALLASVVELYRRQLQGDD